MLRALFAAPMHNRFQFGKSCQVLEVQKQVALATSNASSKEDLKRQIDELLDTTNQLKEQLQKVALARIASPLYVMQIAEGRERKQRRAAIATVRGDKDDCWKVRAHSRADYRR